MLQYEEAGSFSFGEKIVLLSVTGRIDISSFVSSIIMKTIKYFFDRIVIDK